MATLLVIMKLVSLDLMGYSIRPVVQIWGHSCKVQLKDWEIWKFNLKWIAMNLKRNLQNIYLFLGLKLHLLLCQSDSSSVTLGEPEDSNESRKDGAARWAASQCAPCSAWTQNCGVPQLGNICTQCSSSFQCRNGHSALSLCLWQSRQKSQEQGTWGEGFNSGESHINFF